MAYVTVYESDKNDDIQKIVMEGIYIRLLETLRYLELLLRYMQKYII